MSPRHALAIIAAFVVLAVYPGAARAQRVRCDTLETRTAPGTLSGRRIGAVDVRTLGPVPFPGAALVEHLHVRTRASTVRRELRFAPGDTVDTLSMAESMRRLRGHGYIADAVLRSVSCGHASPVAIRITARDEWSTRPEVKMGSGGSTVAGLDERNLLGTGREAMVYVRATGSRVGLGVMFADPWVPGTDLSASARVDTYRDGHSWYGTAQTRRLSVFDPWHGELTVQGYSRRTVDSLPDLFNRQAASLLVARRVAASERGATAALFGAEFEHADLTAAPDAAIVGPPTVRRDFVGLDLGLRRDAASYDTLSWLLPRNTLVDLPHGIEGDGIVGLGTDLRTRRPVLHLDAWVGHVWLAGDQIVVADAWASGFWGDDYWNGGTARASLTGYRQARRGTWMVQLAAEREFDPDPDVRALASFDPTLPLFPKETRFADAAVAATAERDVRLFSVSRSWAVDGALFTAASMHEDPTSSDAPRLWAGVVGMGVRLAPRRAGRGTARLDVGYPVVRSAALRRGVYVGMSIMPWLGAIRDRDGRVQR